MLLLFCVFSNHSFSSHHMFDPPPPPPFFCVLSQAHVTNGKSAARTRNYMWTWWPLDCRAIHGQTAGSSTIRGVSESSLPVNTVTVYILLEDAWTTGYSSRRLMNKEGRLPVQKIRKR